MAKFYSTDFLDEIEKKNKVENKNKHGKFIDKESKKRKANAIQPTGFKGLGLVPDDQIDADEKLVAKSNYGDIGYVAESLELVVHAKADTFFKAASDDNIVETINTSKFDDLMNRVDTAITIHRKDKRDLTFALDLYSGRNPDEALGKISEPSHIPYARTFAGCTEIRYYKDSKGRKKSLKNVPRYTIGVDKRSIESAVDVVAKTGNLFQSTHIDIVKFKMLFEMCLQNQLYMSYLKDYDGNDSPYKYAASQDDDFRPVASTIKNLDKIYLAELEQVTESLSSMESFRGRKREDIARMLRSGYYDSESQENVPGDETFKAIIRATLEIRDAKKLEEKEEKTEDERLILARRSGERLLRARDIAEATKKK